jgi:hypothetical protein
MRKCGVSGGGTWRRESPQHGHCSLPTISARSQWPWASQAGLMHCTVQPGKNCMNFSPRAASPWAALRPHFERCRASPGGISLRRSRGKIPGRKMWLSRQSETMRGFCRECDVVSRENGTRYRGRLAAPRICREPAGAAGWRIGRSRPGTERRPASGSGRCSKRGDADPRRRR